MYTDHVFARLQDLASGRAADEAASMPPDAYAVFRRDGLTFGKFVVLEELGHGGSSVVYRAWQATPGREVALKVVSGLDPELRDRFRREVSIAANLSHPGILPLLESGESTGSQWLAMPLVRGETLDRCSWTNTEAALAVAAAARAVQAAHDAGVVHRDLKPRNIMKDASGIRVMDFGLARTEGESTRISVTGQILGTPLYMSPEQAAGLPVDARTDIYGLGATLYRLCTGRPPYEADSLAGFLRLIASSDPLAPSRVSSAVDVDLELVLLKSMDRDPGLRYSTAAALAVDLERFARGEPVSARLLPARVRWGRMLKRRRTAAIFSALLLIGLVALAFAWASGGDDQHSHLTTRTRYARQMEDLLALAGQAEKRGNLTEAIEYSSSALSLDPESSEFLFLRARCFMGKMHWSEAIADLDKEIALEPRRAEAWQRRGLCRKGTEEYAAALADLNQAIALRPGETGQLLDRCEIYASLKEWKSALEDVDAAVAQGPTDLAALSTRAVLLGRMGRHADSVAGYDAAIALGGIEPRFLQGRGHEKLFAGDPKGALMDLRQAVDLDPRLVHTCEGDIEWAEEALGKETAK